MKKLTKAAGIIAAGIVAGTAYSFIRDYRTMKKMEEKLDKMPVNQLKKKMAKVKKDETKTTIEVPKDMMLMDRLRVCANILKK